MNRQIMLFLVLCSWFCVLQINADTKDSHDSSQYLKMQEMYENYKKDAFKEAPDVSVEKYLELKDSLQVVLVDVREKKEMKVSQIPGAISFEEFEENKDEYKNSLIVLYCTIGYRSGEETVRLREEGFKAYNLTGSLLAWAHAGKKFIDRNGDTTMTIHVYGKKWDLAPKEYKTVW